MITFDLSCEGGHRFEGWFRNREDFERQIERGQVSCPLCGSTAVTRELSAVAVHVPRRSAADTPASPQTERRENVPASSDASTALKGRPFFQAMTEFIEKHFEDVGATFAEEARKIDRGDVEARNIRGTTTPEEEEALEEEGIGFLKIPLPKYDA